MTDAPETETESDVLCCTDVVTNDVIMTTSEGMPMESVSLSAGSCQSMCHVRWMPCLRSDGIWTSTCTATPAGLPMARISVASVGFTFTSAA